MFAEKFLKRLSAIQTMFLFKHYERSCSELSFVDWVESYKDLPNILMTMTKE